MDGGSRRSKTRVFVLGAGASKSCGLPLTNELFPEVLPKVAPRSRLLELIEYLYPHFRLSWRNYPRFEEFLSLLDVHLEFNPKVKRRHLFGNTEVQELKESLLSAVSRHLCDLVSGVDIRNKQMFRLAQELGPRDVVITFNWDTTLELALNELGRARDFSYVLTSKYMSLLKPHGSVDWYDSQNVRLKKDRVFSLIPGIGRIKVFEYFSFPHVQEQLVPVIVPPVIHKTFEYREFDRIWRDSWKALRRADEIYVIGFSLPPEDLHIRFVMRTAIRANEIERSRSDALRVVVVNPDRDVYLRFARLVVSKVRYLEAGFEDVSLDEIRGK